MVDRETGATTIFTQGAVGTAEPERSTYHDMHERLEFTHRDYAQAEYAARLIADEVVDTCDDIAAGTPEERLVPFDDRHARARWPTGGTPGPLSHPYPDRLELPLRRTRRCPVAGPAGLPARPAHRPGRRAVDPGCTDDSRTLGIPVPENYRRPSYGALEENVSVHLQAVRLGEILFTMCSCEQWADQARNIKTRTDKVAGNQYDGYDWAEHCEQTGDDWSCVDPRTSAAADDRRRRRTAG